MTTKTGRSLHRALPLLRSSGWRDLDTYTDTHTHIEWEDLRNQEWEGHASILQAHLLRQKVFPSIQLCGIGSSIIIKSSECLTLSSSPPPISISFTLYLCCICHFFLTCLPTLFQFWSDENSGLLFGVLFDSILNTERPRWHSGWKILWIRGLCHK